MPNLSLPDRPNIVLIITDQQTWNPKWTDTLLVEGEEGLTFPAMQKLLKNGIAFNRAHCNSCTCSPSRTTLFTGTYPAHHRAKQVLAFDDPSSGTQHNQGILSNDFQNMARMMASAGYQVTYKGKWHITKPAEYVKCKTDLPGVDEIDQKYWTPSDAGHIKDLYGFDGWNYPDAGDDANIFNFGSGNVNNDARFVSGEGQSAMYGNRPPTDTRNEDCALEYIRNINTADDKAPFFLVVSLVNPHDVLSYPGNATNPATGETVHPRLYKAGGYREEMFNKIKVDLPDTWNECLRSKPKIQRKWRHLLETLGPIYSKRNSKEIAKKYLQFYAYLSSLVDSEIDKVLTALDDRGFAEDTLIVRIADHGDMSMAHGMLRQKMFNVYRETLNVPMILSHPSIKGRKDTEALAGLIDLMPTFAEIAGVDSDDWNFQGKSLLGILDGSKDTCQNHIHFTYDDDYPLALAPEPETLGATHIRCIIEDEENSDQKWKYAVYFDPYYGQKFEYEMYDLTNDPEETKNLAGPEFRTSDQRRLHQRLYEVMMKKGTLPDSVIWPEVPATP